MKFTFFLVSLLLAVAQSSAAEMPSFELNIKDHRFNPARLDVPAATKIKLVIHNLDATDEEFESYELNREKIIPGGKTATIYIGPLETGDYPFFGEFNEATAKGVLHAE